MIENNTMTHAMLPEVVFRKSDYERIFDLVDMMPKRLSHVSSLLRQELARARIVEEPPSDSVQMYSTVRFKLASIRKVQRVTIVFPHEADLEQERIPVTSLLGAALIGLRKDSTMSWRSKDGVDQTLTVIEIVK